MSAAATTPLVGAMLAVLQLRPDLLSRCKESCTCNPGAQSKGWQVVMWLSQCSGTGRGPGLVGGRGGGGADPALHGMFILAWRAPAHSSSASNDLRGAAAHRPRAASGLKGSHAAAALGGQTAEQSSFLHNCT